MEYGRFRSTALHKHRITIQIYSVSIYCGIREKVVRESSCFLLSFITSSTGNIFHVFYTYILFSVFIRSNHLHCTRFNTRPFSLKSPNVWLRASVHSTNLPCGVCVCLCVCIILFHIILAMKCLNSNF